MIERNDGVITFLGDVFLPRPVEISLDLPHPFVLNFEAPVAEGEPTPGKINLSCERVFLAETFPVAPLAVCLANNHIMDYGARALQQTIRQIDNAGSRCFGAGLPAEHHGNPLLLRLGGRIVALGGYCSEQIRGRVGSSELAGPRPLRIESLKDDLKLARSGGAEVFIACFHFGRVNVVQPRPEEVAIARQAIDAGVDLVIGHHSHLIQAHEMYRGKPIFYGLGNCIFPEFVAPAGDLRVKHIGRQYGWNRRGLAVDYDVRSASFHARQIAFEQGRLVDRGPARLKLLQKDADRKRAYHRRSVTASKLRVALAEFFHRPRLPKLSTIRSLLSDRRGHVTSGK